MATFLKEDNKQLLKKSYKIPKELKNKLSATLAATSQYKDLPGHKRLEHVVSDTYFNDRSEGKSTQGMKGRVPFGLLKRWQNAFKYTQPNGVEHAMLGGEDMKNWVNSTINRERTMVKPVLPVKDNNITKPQPSKATSKKPLKIGDTKLHISEEILKNKKTIIISENQLLSLQDLLNEGRNADKAKAKTLEVIRNFFNNASWLNNEFQDAAANPNHLSVIDYIENKLKELCFHANIPDSIIRLEPIIMNIALGLGFEQQNQNTQKLNRLFKMVEFIKNGQQKGNLPIQLNKLTLENTTYDSLNEVFGKVIDEEEAAEKERIENADYTKGMNPNYEIISNVDYDTAHKYGNYSCSGSRLCYTQSENTWHNYTKDGENTAYIILRKDWQEVPQEHGEDTPYDDYGLSMIFLFIDPFGDLAYSNTRWNHDTRGQGPRNVDQSFTKEQISQLLNINFNKVFKGKRKQTIEELIAESIERLKNGEQINKVFRKAIPLENNNYAIKVREKWNILNCNTYTLLSPIEWFDKLSESNDGIIKVVLHNKTNYITQDGNFLWDKPLLEWFSGGKNFENGFAVVNLGFDIGYNWLKSNGEILCKNQAFEECFSFENGFAVFVDNDTYVNYMKTDGTVLAPDMKFDDCEPFKGDYGLVKRNGNYNFINTQGKIMFDQWFDNISYYDGSYAQLYYNGQKCMLNIPTGLLATSNGKGAGEFCFKNEWYFCEYLLNIKTNKYNYYLRDNIGQNGVAIPNFNKPIFPNVSFDSCSAFKRYSSERSKEIDTEIAKLKDLINTARNDRDYQYYINQITELYRMQHNTFNWFAMVILNGEKYCLDIKGNLYDRSMTKVSKISSIFGE